MVLRFEEVRKSFRDGDSVVPVLQDVSFELEAGQTLALRGESGSGKSTLLHIAGALEAPDAGHVWVSGQDLTRLNENRRARLRRTDIALVFQQFNLIPSLTVEANISFHAALSGHVDLLHIEQISAALGLLGQMKKLRLQKQMVTRMSLIILKMILQKKL